MITKVYLEKQIELCVEVEGYDDSGDPVGDVVISAIQAKECLDALKDATSLRSRLEELIAGWESETGNQRSDPNSAELAEVADVVDDICRQLREAMREEV